MSTNSFPVIIGMGGVNPAGRSSFNHAFNWAVFDDLTKEQKSSTLRALAGLNGMTESRSDGIFYAGKNITPDNLPTDLIEKLKQQTFIRKLERSESYLAYRTQKLNPTATENLHTKIPVGFDLNNNSAAIDPLNRPLKEGEECFLLSRRNISINSGGQIPSGFDPGALYNSAKHPLSLKIAVYGVSDALHSTGLDWMKIINQLDTNQIGVFASSMLGNMDEFGANGYIQASLMGKRPTSKQLALSMPQMVSDFINAYVIKSLGFTNASIGACATFLYNLHNAVHSIQKKMCRLAIVGASDAPLLPEIIEAYAAMKALATDEDLLALDGLSAGEPDYRRACRPFGDNCGFVLGESAQFFILCDDQLAVDIGANILGSVGGVFISADGGKKSISKPGPGNLFSMVQSVSLAQAIIGEKNLKNNTFVSAHGSGTPQNRVTESFIINNIASLFGIKNWQVCGVKSYLGHSTGAAAGDQLAFMLGSFANNIIPGISTVEKIADDVYNEYLKFCIKNVKLKQNHLSGGFINSKGFGGNNATAFILSPAATQDIMLKRHGQKKLAEFKRKQEKTIADAAENDIKISKNILKPVYHAENIDDDSHPQTQIKAGYFLCKDKRLKLINKNPYL